MNVKCGKLKIMLSFKSNFILSCCAAVKYKFYSMIEFNMCDPHDPHRNNFVQLLNLLEQDVEDA